MAQAISIYATSAAITPESDNSVMVTMTGVEMSDVLSEFVFTDVMDNYDYDQIADYLAGRKESDDE